MINAMIMVAFQLTKIQRSEHKIAKPTATEWKEIKETSTVKASAHMAYTHAHTFVICLSNGTCFLLMTCPCKNQAGAHFGVLTGMWNFTTYNRAQGH